MSGKSLPEESSPWVGTSGIPAHPNAPAGGGGPGGFRQSPALGREGNDADPIPHPQSPGGRNRRLTEPEVHQLRAKGVPLLLADVKPLQVGPAAQPPPPTQPTKFA